MARTSVLLSLIVAVIRMEGALAIRVFERRVAPHRLHDFNATLVFFDHRFKLVEDLGYLSWKPSSSGTERPRLCEGDVDLEEVRCGLGADPFWQLPQSTPPRLVNLGRLRAGLPRKLHYDHLAEGAGYLYQSPHAIPSVAAPFVAAQRFDIGQIDFVVGGSLLHSLATGDFAGKDYTVQRWGRAVMIRRFSSEPHFVDLQSKHFQIERLLIGRSMGDVRVNQSSAQHLQVLRMGTFNVLFVAKVDAMVKLGRPAEVTASWALNWWQIMFSLLAKGSTKLVHAIVTEKWPSLYLTKVDEYNLRDIIQRTTTRSERLRLAANILNSLRLIHARVFNASAGGQGLFHMNATRFIRRPTTLWTHAPRLHVLEDKNRSLLPEADVLNSLFPMTDEGMGSS